jgi:SAM-dependent methyltransferase
METIASRVNPQSFWDRKAKTFPRYTPGEDNYEAGVLALAKSNGVVFKDALVLDVGCGSGMYTIRLAQEARRVVALDLSKEMLSILRQDAQEYGVKNIEIVHSDWLSYEVQEKPEVVFCSMTPALSTQAGRDKVLDLSGAKVVFLGWCQRPVSDVLEPLFNLFQLAPGPFRGGPELRGYLEDQKVPFEFFPVSGKWRVKHSKEGLKEICMCALSNYGVTVDARNLDDYLERFRQEDGNYLEMTSYQIEMVLWQNS